jgi:hypothetical protein
MEDSMYKCSKCKDTGEVWHRSCAEDEGNYYPCTCENSLMDSFEKAKKDMFKILERIKSQGKIDPIREIITQYWRDNYAGLHCKLCGNSGKLDTTGVRTLTGIPVGRKQYCICPNGQLARVISRL